MLRNAIVFRESMEADRIVKVIGAFIAAIVLYSSFAAADETVTATDGRKRRLGPARLCGAICRSERDATHQRLHV